MKTIYKNFLFGIVSMMCTSAMAQVSGYAFAQSNGTYTPITGGTVVATCTSNAAPGNLASTVWNLPTGTFPFTFVFNGIGYTGCNISCNGYITFGATPPLTTGGSPISAATAYDGAVSAWGRATNGGYSLGVAAPYYTSEIRVEVIGTAPTRTFVIQYDNWRYASGTGLVVWLADYQIRLVETTNIVEIAYGPGVMAGGSLTTGGFNCQVGLRGATNTDFNNRSSAGAFNTSIPGTVNTANQAIGVAGGVSTNMPPDGLVYDWMPRCSSTPNTATISVNTTTICALDTLKFSSIGGTPYFDITYQWKVSPTVGGPYTNVPGPPSGTTFPTYKTTNGSGFYYYVLVATCSNVPSSSTSNELFVDVKPLPILDILSNPALNTTVTPIETCFGETYTLTAQGAATYTWIGGPTTDSFIVTPVANPSYTVEGTSADGCFASRTLDILVNPLPVMSATSSPIAVCPGKDVVVAVTGNAVTYTWTAPNSNAFLITVNPTVTTNYTVTGTSITGCTNIAMHQVFVYTVSPLGALSTGSICKGESVDLTAGGSTNFTWTAPGTYTTGQMVSLSPAQTTTYTISAVNANGCATQTTLVQVVQPCTGLGEVIGDLNSLQIFPNPNNGVFTVELHNGAVKMLDLMDVSGKVVYSASTSDNKTELNINNLANGIYHLRVQSNNDVRVVKVVKQ